MLQVAEPGPAEPDRRPNCHQQPDRRRVSYGAARPQDARAHRADGGDPERHLSGRRARLLRHEEVQPGGAGEEQRRG